MDSHFVEIPALLGNKSPVSNVTFFNLFGH